MRRVLLSFLLVSCVLQTLFCSCIFCKAEEKETTTEVGQLYAQSAVLMDADSGRVLFEKEGNTILPMASTTKIMTCIVSLEKGNLQDWVTVSEYAASMPDVQLNIRTGEQYRLQDLLYSLMLESHNDSAVAIAEHIGGSVEGFTKMMNEKAKELGCAKTCFLTPNGLDAQKELTLKDGSKKTVMHSTTAEDLALIMSYCIKKSPKKEAFLEITRTSAYGFSNKEGTRSFSCSNHNAFLNMMDGALTGKTGFTGKAGYCYVGALEREGKTFVVALLACGWPNHKTYKWSDTKKLMTYGIEKYQKVDVSEKTLQKEWLQKIPVLGAQTKHLFETTYAELCVREETKPPVLLMREGEEIQVKCRVKKQLMAPVKEKQEVGSVQYLVDGKVVWERKICTKNAYKKRDYLWYLHKAFSNYIGSF